jgi:hypothetical protein
MQSLKYHIFDIFYIFDIKELLYIGFCWPLIWFKIAVIYPAFIPIKMGIL